MFCQKCGHEVLEDAVYCANCGTHLKETKKSFMGLSIHFSKSDQISLIICAIWFVIWIFVMTVAFDNQEEKELCFLLALFIPIMFLLVRRLISLIVKKDMLNKQNDIMPLSVFSKQFDGMRLETVFNKVTDTKETFCVFYNNTRVSFGASLINCSSEDLKKHLNEIMIISHGGKFVMEKKNNQSTAYKE